LPAEPASEIVRRPIGRRLRAGLPPRRASARRRNRSTGRTGNRQRPHGIHQ
jgi:hypothetical protein